MLDKLIKATEEDIRRFLKYVDKLPNGCWFWTGARSRGKKNKKWYGSFWLPAAPELGRPKGITVRAHRFAIEVFRKQPCPPGHDRGHTCHFSLCVCPWHVVIMTKEENQRQKMERRNLTGEGNVETITSKHTEAVRWGSAADDYSVSEE